MNRIVEGSSCVSLMAQRILVIVLPSVVGAVVASVKLEQLCAKISRHYRPGGDR